MHVLREDELGTSAQPAPEEQVAAMSRCAVNHFLSDECGARRAVQATAKAIPHRELGNAANTLMVVLQSSYSKELRRVQAPGRAPVAGSRPTLRSTLP